MLFAVPGQFLPVPLLLNADLALAWHSHPHHRQVRYISRTKQLSVFGVLQDYHQPYHRDRRQSSDTNLSGDYNGTTTTTTKTTTTTTTTIITTTSPPLIYFITPTYPRREQVAELTRLGQTLMHVPRLHWIVADDRADCSPHMARLLPDFSTCYYHT